MRRKYEKNLTVVQRERRMQHNEGQEAEIGIGY